jgi:hemolysin activation/secretion protein
MEYQVDETVNSSNQKGYAYTAGATASYPFVRSVDFSLTGVGSIDHKKLVNSVLESNSSNKNIDVGSVGVNATMQDGFLAGATNLFSLAAYAGSLDLSHNESVKSQDESSARTDGMYSKVTVAASRLQSFDAKNQLLVSGNAQFAPTNLDSSEQFSLGGPDGVRAYPVNEGMGSVGFLGRIEHRHNLIDKVQLFDFYDAGWIQQYAHSWGGWNASSGMSNDYWLQGIGVGVNWHPVDAGAISLTVAHTLGSNPGKTDGKNSDGYNDHMRFFLKASFAF